jgi:DNA excision repair protein ERCC-2
MIINLRPWQREVLDAIPEELDPETNIFINAPTGSGKTILSLLIGSKLDVDLIIVVTRTRNEGFRFWEDAVTKLGLRHYPFTFIAKADFCRVVKDPDVRKELLEDEESSINCEGCKLALESKKETREWLRQTMDLPLYIKVFKEVNPNLPPQEYEKELLGRMGDRFMRFCAYSVVKNLAKESARRGYPIMLIGTYPHLFTAYRLFRTILSEFLNSEERFSNRFLVIIDEAHNLDNLPDMVERRVSPMRLERLMNTGEKFCERVEKMGARPPECEEARKNMEKYKEVKDEFGRKLEELGKKYNVGENMYKRISLDDVESLLSILERFMPLALLYQQAMERFMERVNPMDPFIVTYGLMRKERDYLDGASVSFDDREKSILVDPDVWRFYIHGNHTYALVMKPITPKPIINSARRKFNDVWVMMSGTLQSREYIEKNWGLTVDYYFDMSTKVKLGKMHVKFITSVTSRYEKRSEEMYTRYALVISDIIAKNDGKVFLVVYPSYDMMRSIMPKLNSMDVVHIKETEVKSLAKVREMVEGTDKKVVVHAVAGGRFTEGIEIVKDGVSLINHVIMAGMPIPNIRDDYITDRINASGMDPIEWLLEHARIITLQARGRAIRSDKDEATIWLLDSRFPGYATKWGLTAP